MAAKHCGGMVDDVALAVWTTREEPAAFERWLRRDLRERYGAALGEALPPELLELLPADTAG